MKSSETAEHFFAAMDDMLEAARERGSNLTYFFYGGPDEVRWSGSFRIQDDGTVVADSSTIQSKTFTQTFTRSDSDSLFIAAARLRLHGPQYEPEVPVLICHACQDTSSG